MSFRKTATRRTLANKMEIGVWILAAGVQGITPRKNFPETVNTKTCYLMIMIMKVNLYSVLS